MEWWQWLAAWLVASITVGLPLGWHLKRIGEHYPEVPEE